MYFQFRPRFSLVTAGLAAVLGVSSLAPEARANVYATNIKLNGGITNLTVASGESVGVSYILNEPALLGVTVNIASGASVIRSLTFPANTNGTLFGLNQVTWDGKDGQGNPAPA